MVDIKALRAQHAEKKKDSKQLICLLGIRGSGKSAAAAGTWGERRVLLIQGSQESHGSMSAATVATKPENIFPITIDIDEVTGKRRNSVGVFKAISEVTSDLDFMKDFDVVVIDSLAVVDEWIDSLPQIRAANGYDIKREMDRAYASFLDSLIQLRDRGTHHVVVTIPTERRGSSTEGFFEVPSLKGASAVNNIIGAANTILFVKRDEATVERDGEEVEITVHVFDTNVKSEKTGTKMSGQKYTLPVECRVAGVKTQDLPPRLHANLGKLIK